MDSPTPYPGETPVKPNPVPPGTTTLDLLKYLLSTSTGRGISRKLMKALAAAVLAWWGVDKVRSFKDGASLSDVTRWQSEVSNRLERLEEYAVSPPTNPDPFEVRRQAAIRRVIPPPMPLTNRPPRR